MEYRSPHIIKKARICRESPFTGCSLRLYTACGNNTPPSPLVLLSRQNYASLVKVWYAQCRQKEKHQNQTNNRQILVLSASDPCGNRTHVNGVRGRCLNHLTNGPSIASASLLSPGPPSGTRTRDPLIKSQLLYQLS